MKKSIKLFLILLLLIFISDRVVYSIIYSFDKKVYTGSTTGKVNSFLKQKDSVDILIFGSSRALHHVKSKMFDESAYNMGVDGTRIGYAAALIGTLKKENQTIFVHIDHNRVFDQNFKGDDALSLKNKIVNDKDLKSFFKEYYPQEVFISQMLRCYLYNGKVLSIFKNYFFNKNEVDNENGFSPIRPSIEQNKIFDKMLMKQKGFLNVNIVKPTIVNTRFESFIDRIIATANHNNSKVVFFTSPSLNKVDNDVKNAVSHFFKEKNVTYLDHIDYIKTINTKLWKDYTHLTEKGAILYTDKLIADYYDF